MIHPQPTGRRNLYTAAAVTLLWTLAAFAAAQERSSDCTEHDDGKDGLCGHALAQIARFEYERTHPLRARESDDDTDVTHCWLDIELTPSPNTISGTNTLDVTSRIAGLTEFTLDLFSDMSVDGVSVNGTAASFARPTDEIVIALDRPYNVGETFQVQVTYHGTPYHLSTAAGYSGTHGSPPTVVIASHSQPYNAPAWWPCKEVIADKFTFDIWVTVPDWMIVASNGLLAGTDTLSGSRLRYRWHESYPISVYLVSIAATNYTHWTEYYHHATGDLPVDFYIYPEDVSWVQPLIADMVTMIETLADPGCFGEYPFINEKYGLAEFEGCCGMEHQTITSQGSFPERRNVHELAHMWWGDALTCKTWHDIWLNEGFARYAESLWHERKPGGSYEAYMDHMMLYRPSAYEGTVYRYDISTSSVIFDATYSYNKASWVLHMLRHVLGHEVFFTTLAVYRAAYEGSAADTAEFQAVVENVSGRDMDWFFEEWVYEGGAPYYRYGWKYRPFGVQHEVLLHVEQYQTAYPNFKMPIDVRLTLEGGGQETQVIWQEDDLQWYVLDASGPVTNVELDPDTWILRGALQNVPYITSCNDPFADVNGDNYVDLRDFARFQLCHTGAGVTGTFDLELCGCFDRDGDDDIDLDDLAALETCWAGPTIPADPACDDGQVLFADDFDADSSAGWTVNASSADTAVVFAYDYSADGIPAAPHAADNATLGVKFTVNMALPEATEAITISPTGLVLTGDYVLTFDLWINCNGPLPNGGTGSTEFVTAGIGSDGHTVNFGDVTGVGGWFAVDGEGGSARDYRAYKNAGEQYVASGQYNIDTNNNTGTDLSSYFSPQQPPAWQQATYPQQTGATAAGCAGFAWHTVQITVDATAGTARWTIDDLTIATLDRQIGSDFPLTGNIALGYLDPFTSVSDNPALSFGLIDNVRVTRW